MLKNIDVKNVNEYVKNVNIYMKNYKVTPKRNVNKDAKKNETKKKYTKITNI